MMKRSEILLAGKIINKLTIVLITTLTIITLSGCGGGGGGGSDASFKSNTATAIAVCNVTDTSWTLLDSGDVVSTSNNTQLKFDHDSNGNKQVCVVTGNATVLKG